MEEEFIPYEQALTLKELGFNENCIATFDEDKNFELQDFEQNYDTFPKHIIGRPLYQQAFRWFREKHNLDGDIKQTMNRTPGESKYLTKYTYNILGNREKVSSTVFKPIEGNIELFYEEAELKCLKKLIEIVKNK